MSRFLSIYCEFTKHKNDVVSTFTFFKCFNKYARDEEGMSFQYNIRQVGKMLKNHGIDKVRVRQGSQLVYVYSGIKWNQKAWLKFGIESASDNEGHFNEEELIEGLHSEF
jgi:hypothetical protein